MTLFDVILLLILFGFMLFGVFFGFVHAIGSLLGVVIGAWVAGHYYEAAASWFMPFMNDDWARIIAFLVILVIINRAVGFIFWLAEIILKRVTSLPFIKGANRVLGFIVGLAEGTLVIGIIVYAGSKLTESFWLRQILQDSVVAPWFVKSAVLLLPLIPEALKILPSVF
jgi:membrane protein required for colicin V production